MLRPYFAAVGNDERPGAIPGAVVLQAMRQGYFGRAGIMVPRLDS